MTLWPSDQHFYAPELLKESTLTVLPEESELLVYVALWNLSFWFSSWLLTRTSVRVPWSHHLNLQESFLTLHLRFLPALDFLWKLQIRFLSLLTWTSRRASWPCTWASGPSLAFLPEHQLGFLGLLTWTSRKASWPFTWASGPSLDKSEHQLGFLGFLTWTCRRASWPCTWASGSSIGF